MLTTAKLRTYQSGFTIVELLVVIVVIGILAAITVVSYTGISQRAVAASLQSDLSNAAQQLKIFQIDNGSYPTTIDCSQSNSSTNKCIQPSSGTTFSYTVNNSVNPPTFSLTATNGSLSYVITNDSAPTLVSSATAAWVGISASGLNTCAVTSTNKLYCWGKNTNGQLGNNSTTNSSIPVAVDTTGVLSGKTTLMVASGQSSSCLMASDRQAYCWGLNTNGILGNNSTTESHVPVAVDTTGVLSGKTITSLAVGNTAACAIASDNLAYCWGSNNSGALGNNSTTSSYVPVAVYTAGVLSGKTFKSIVSGTATTCAIASDSLAYCWGQSTNGELGNNSTATSLVPVAVDTSGVLSGKTIRSISGGSAQACVIASDNLAYCWGKNTNGQLGNNSTTNSSVPVAVDTTGVLSGKTLISISVGYAQTCAVASDNKAYCWGQNPDGELGNNSTTESHVPVAVDTTGVLSGKSIIFITVGSYHTCVIASDNQVYCWGKNVLGQLGNNSTTSSSVPVAITLP